MQTRDEIFDAIVKRFGKDRVTRQKDWHLPGSIIVLLSDGSSGSHLRVAAAVGVGQHPFPVLHWPIGCYIQGVPMLG